MVLSKAGILSVRVVGRFGLAPKQVGVNYNHGVIKAILCSDRPCQSCLKINRLITSYFVQDVCELLLCLSNNPLLQGLSAGVVLTIMLKFSARSLVSSYLNSRPLSERINFGEPCTLIQVWRNFCTMIDTGLLLISVAAPYLVNKSIK